jgi:hypothetical protein
LGSCGNPVIGICSYARVVHVSRGQAADGDNECCETRLSPLLRVSIILRQCQHEEYATKLTNVR